jgi:iron-sulfur cluster assembly protein
MAITLTPPAAKQIKDSIRRRGHGLGFRLGTREAGCTGFKYIVDYVEEKRLDDVVFETEGVHVFVQASALAHLDGTIVDYVTEGVNSQFVYRNPNVTDSCGCGESFTTRLNSVTQ